MDQRLSRFLSDEELRAMRAPIEEARTLPREAFTDPAFLELEFERIYARHWIAVAFDLDIPEPGDALPVELCGVPLLLVRGRDGRIRAFHNIVPYDGCPALIDPTRALDRIETPYHGWIYDLEGKLQAIPCWDGTRKGNLESVRRFDVNLTPVACESFLGVVCLNLCADPPPLAEVTDSVLEEFEEYDFGRARPLTDERGQPLVVEDRVQTNWKTYFENACINVLHENFVHEIYNKSPHHPRMAEDGVKTFFEISRGLLLGLGYRHSRFVETYGEAQLPHLGHDGKKPDKATFATLYPNFYICIAPDFVELGLALPEAPGLTHERRIYLVHDDVVRDPELRASCVDGIGFFAEAAREDNRICEAVQKARRSPVHSQKFYSPFWDELHYRFSQILLDDLEAEPA